KEFMPACYAELDHMYARLDIHYDHAHGESFYQPMLADVVADLQARGIAEPSEGAIVIFVGDREKDPPALIRYRHGAYGYMTTDLATIKYRVETWHPDAILYVVGAPQAFHFKRLFEAARRWGYDQVELEHVSFGSVLGPDRKLFRTRAGTSTALEDLL